MGWSELVVRPDISSIFKKAKKKYTLKWVNAPYPQVRIQYEGNISIASAKAILALFPDFVYVELVPDSPFQISDPGDEFQFGD